MPIRAFKEVPKNAVEWGRFFKQTEVTPDPDSVGEDELKNGSVTFEKIQDVDTGSLIGRATAPAGQVQQIPVTGGLQLTSGTLIRSALTGAVTAAAGSSTTAIADKAVTYPKLQDANADTLLGRGSGTGVIGEIPCTAAGRALIDDADASAQRTTLGLGTAAVKNTGTSGDAVPLLNVAATISAAWTFGTEAVFSDPGQGLKVESITPVMRLVETDGAANNRRWRIVVTAERLTFDAASDDETTSATIFDVDRTNVGIDRMMIRAPLQMVNLSADPGSAQNGDMYYNTSTNKFRGYAAGSWVDLH